MYFVVNPVAILKQIKTGLNIIEVKSSLIISTYQSVGNLDFPSVTKLFYTFTSKDKDYPSVTQLFSHILLDI